MARHQLFSTRVPQNGNMHYYHLPKGFIKLTLLQMDGGIQDPDNADNNQPPKLQLSAERVLHPDPQHRYYLYYKVDGRANNTLKVEFHETGYLKRIESVREDVTLQIVENVLDAVKQAVIPDITSRSIGEFPVTLYEVTFDPFDAGKRAEVINNIRGLDPDFDINFQLMGEPVEQTAADSPRTENVITPQSAPKPATLPGVYCRPMELGELSWTLQGVPHGELMMMPHPQVVHSVMVPHAPLVESKLILEFSPFGYPTLIDINQPSWGLALSKFPAKFLRGLISIPAQILQLRVNYQSQKADASEQLLAAQERIKMLEERKADTNRTTERKI